jgi:polar amino acid transport system substrate-binding protein
VAKLYPDAVAVPTVAPLGTFPAAFAVRRGDMDFVNDLNSWIAALKADKWINTHRKYWFRRRTGRLICDQTLVSSR